MQLLNQFQITSFAQQKFVDHVFDLGCFIFRQPPSQGYCVELDPQYGPPCGQSERFFVFFAKSCQRYVQNFAHTTIFGGDLSVKPVFAGETTGTSSNWR
jgi:hypothetical protein